MTVTVTDLTVNVAVTVAATVIVTVAGTVAVTVAATVAVTVAVTMTVAVIVTVAGTASNNHCDYKTITTHAATISTMLLYCDGQASDTITMDITNWVNVNGRHHHNVTRHSKYTGLPNL